MSGKDRKADRLLIRSKVRVLAADEESIAARVIGDYGTYLVNLYTEDGKLVKECDCVYSTEYHPISCECSHVLAVMRIWRRER